jgi:hypothetical protein
MNHLSRRAKPLTLFRFQLIGGVKPGNSAKSRCFETIFCAIDHQWAIFASRALPLR